MESYRPTIVAQTRNHIDSRVWDGLEEFRDNGR